MKKSKSAIIVLITTILTIACLVIVGIRSLSEKIGEIEDL